MAPTRTACARATGTRPPASYLSSPRLLLLALLLIMGMGGGVPTLAKV